MFMPTLVAPWNHPDVEWRCDDHRDRTWEMGAPTDCDCGAPGVPYLHGHEYTPYFPPITVDPQGMWA